MPKPKSSPVRTRRHQPSDRTTEDYGGSSEDEDSSTQQDDNRGYSHSNTSGSNYLNVSSRSNLSHHSDLNSSAETHKRTSRFNTSASSETDSPYGARDQNTSKSPSLYPSLDEHKSSDRNTSRSPSQYSSPNEFKTSDIRKTSRSPSQYPSLDEFKSSDIRNESYKPRNIAQEVSSNYVSWLLVSVILGILVGIIVIWYLMPSDHSVEPVVNSTVPPFHRFTGLVSHLELALPNQNKRLWRTVKASAKHVLDYTESDYPVIILMAFPTKHADIAKCIAKNITGNFELSLGNSAVESVVDVSEIQHLDPPLQKKKLDEYLHAAFSHNQRKSFVIDNLQLLHPEAALMLHGYCDNDNAPFKDVMMVLLLYVDGHEVSDYSSASVEGYLEHLWSQGLEVDKVKALLSRVANNIVTVEMEDGEVFSKICS